MAHRKAIVIAARRTVIGQAGGLHRLRKIEALAAPVMQAVLADAGFAAGDVDEIVMGNAAGGGGNPARLCALAAGFPHETPAITIDRQCTSGLDAIIHAARLIEAGAANIVLAGGVESPSTAPWRVEKPRNQYTGLPRFFAEANFAPQETGDPGMIEGAEAVARHFGLSRERQDRLASESHRRAAMAQANHVFEREIVKLGGDDCDECVHKSMSSKLLARLASLIPEGSVTAGNTASAGDGAALALLVSNEVFKGMHIKKGLMLIDAVAAGGDPKLPGVAAIPAVRRLFEKTGVTAADMERIEFTEAFASQVIATQDALGLNPDIVNMDGGALAFGHPFGASGAVLVTRLFSHHVAALSGKAMKRSLAMAASAGGLGVAAYFVAM